MHIHAFVLALLTVMVILIDYIFPSSVFLSQWSLVITILFIEIYLFVSLHRVYNQKWFTTLLKLIVLNVMYSISVMIIFSSIGAMIYYM